MSRFTLGQSPLLFAGMACALAWTLPAANATQDQIQTTSPDDTLQQSVAADSQRYGMYYDKWEPTFYTGFAPRTYEPKRLHLHMGRGNQVRATAVLSDEVLGSYARDLLARYETYRALIDRGRLVLTQNSAFEEFEARVQELQFERLVAEENGLSPAEIRERNLRLMETLNPGRVFRISMPVDEIVRRWAMKLIPEDRQKMIRDRQLTLLNAMLPTRMYVADWRPEITDALKDLIARTPEGAADGDPKALDAVRGAFLAVLERYTHGIYPVRDGNLQFEEFTAIYPVGSFNGYTEYQGRKIPMFPTPGRRSLKTHQRSKTVDHIPTKALYSYSPWIPYMHVGTKLHNSFHTLWWRMEPARTTFLPQSYRAAPASSRTGKTYRYLWLLSRGPMSHGCTHVNTGHIGELRQLLPSETASMYEVDTFINKSHLFDVFDIDGDFEPEVMGVRYYIAYSLKNKKPHRMRAPMERQAFYDWLYGGALDYDEKGRGVFKNIKDGRFVGRTAVNGTDYAQIPLYEAEFQAQTVQFYKLVNIPFARELRKVGASSPFSGKIVAAQPRE